MKKYYDLFDSKESIENEFECSLPEGAEVIYAHYEYEDYSGDAYVLYAHEGQLYENAGGHCSCNGLEGQWTPSVVTFPQLEVALREWPYYRQLRADPEEILHQAKKYVTS